MNLFKKPNSYIRIGRAILKTQEIKDIILIMAPGESKETAVAPFKLKISMKYADNIEVEYNSWEDRQECFESLWNYVKDL